MKCKKVKKEDENMKKTYMVGSKEIVLKDF